MVWEGFDGGAFDDVGVEVPWTGELVSAMRWAADAKNTAWLVTRLKSVASSLQIFHCGEVPACKSSLRQLEIPSGRGEAGMAHQVFEHQTADIRIRQAGREAMPEPVNVDVLQYSLAPAEKIAGSRALPGGTPAGL
jgi:hypothetical protein